MTEKREWCYFNEEVPRALMLLTGFDIIKMHRLENKYWPTAEVYADTRNQSPWWLIRTEFGDIEIGWRKRVISIDWSDTKFRGHLFGDHASYLVSKWITHEDTYTHAYGYAKVVEYLTTLNEQLRLIAKIEAGNGKFIVRISRKTPYDNAYVVRFIEGEIGRTPKRESATLFGSYAEAHKAARAMPDSVRGDYLDTVIHGVTDDEIKKEVAA